MAQSSDFPELEKTLVQNLLNDTVPNNDWFTIQEDTDMNKTVPQEENKDDDFYKYPWLPKELLEIDLNKITMSKSHSVPGYKGSFTRKLHYEGSEIRIQTPCPTICMFGVQNYNHPIDQGTVLEKKPHYSIHISLKTDNQEQSDFKQLCENLDKFAIMTFIGPAENYSSAIRYNNSNKSLPPVLRVKLPSTDDGEILVSVYEGENHWRHIPYQQLRQLIKHGTRIQCILAITGIWKAGSKFGLSYKVLQIKILSCVTGPLFRVQ